jgi:site-specific DNA recombinase
VRVDVPDWRIVDEKLWDAVRQRIEFVHKRMGASRCGGLMRTEQSRKYLFSGLLLCGECESRMVIVSGGGKRGYVRYGCPSYRYRGVCENALTIRRERLEEQLLGALEERLVTPEIMQYTLRRFREELDKRLAETRKKGARSDLQREKRDLKEHRPRLSEAIAAAGHSTTLLDHLASKESEIADVERRLANYQPFDTKMTDERLRAFVNKSVLHLRGILRDDNVGQAKTALAKHIRQLVLTPKTLPSGPVFEVSGSMDPLGGDDVMLVVARDGIEPPTPAFSGPRSTD